MKVFEQIEVENKKIASDILQLAGTENTRLSVVTAIFVRKNNEMRLQNIQDVRKDISYGAKSYGLLPEKYVVSMDGIVKSYIQEINRFMSAYNDEFFNIQNTLKNSEEKQKECFYKIRETIVMKNICQLAGKNPDEYAKLDSKIKEYRKNIGKHEKIILRCDKEFENCKIRREQDFKELFEMKQELSLAVIKKQNVFSRLISKVKNKINGYESFSKYILQKHANKINYMKTDSIEEYIKKVKKYISSFDEEIDSILNS